MTRRKITLGPQDFDAAMRRTASEEASKATKGARLVLVLGLPVGRAAKVTGCSRQAVNAAKVRILDACSVCPMCGHAREKASGGRAAVS